LDENLCDCAAILTVLKDELFPFERHLAHFPRGTLDEDWLYLPGQKGWAVLTKDKAQRYSPPRKDKNPGAQIEDLRFFIGKFER
jgi:hypothetical protein